MKIGRYCAKWRGAIAAVLFSFLCFPNAMPAAHSARSITTDNYSTFYQQHSNFSLNDGVHHTFVSEDIDDDNEDGATDETFAGMMFVLILVLLLAIPIYFLPAVVALTRDHEYKIVITVVNIFCAWTGLVWLGILAWSVWPRQSRAAVKEDRMSFGGEFAPTRPVTPPPFPSSTFYGTTSDGLTEENMNKLEKLGHLRQEGVLTEAEFQQAKERIFKNI